MSNRKVNRKKYSKMQILLNRILVIAVILLIIAIVSYVIKSLKENKNNASSSSLTSSSLSQSSSSTASSQQSSSEQTSSSLPESSSSSSQITAANIPLLINKDNPIPDDFKLDLVTIDGGKQMDRAAAGAFNKMKDAYAAYALKQGYTNESNSKIWAQSPYRSHERQTSLWTQRYNDNKKALGSDEAAYIETVKWTAYPGTSEHETGLAVDINLVDTSFENTKQFEWLIKNCADYGFILRYPKDKISKTNIDYEPWHYRYVGVEHAKYIMQNKLCLEEYVEQLKKQGE